MTIEASIKDIRIRRHLSRIFAFDTCTTKYFCLIYENNVVRTADRILILHFLLPSSPETTEQNQKNMKKFLHVNILVTVRCYLSSFKLSGQETLTTSEIKYQSYAAYGDQFTTRLGQLVPHVQQIDRMLSSCPQFRSF